MERRQHGKDRMAVLARGDAPCGEALAVPDAIDVDDRHFGVTRQQKICVHGMRRTARLHGAHRCDQRLANHLAAEHALPADLRRTSAEQVHLERLEIEDVEQVLDGAGGGGHGSRFRCGLPPMTPGRDAKSRCAAAAGVRLLRRKNFGRQIACRPLRTSHTGVHNSMNKYDAAMTAASMTPNQIKVRVTCSWVWSWVWVVIEFAPFLLGGAAGLGPSRSSATPQRIRLSS